MKHLKKFNEGFFESDDDKAINKMMDDELSKLLKEETISLTKAELETFMKDCNDGVWSDSSYKICRFIGIDPTQGT